MRPPKKTARRPTPLLLATVMACGAMPETCWAEEAASAVIALPEISATARKRQEIPRDVPLSLTVVDGQTLEDARINSSEDLFRSVPNMMSNDLGDSRATYYTICGIGPVTQPLGPDDGHAGAGGGKQQTEPGRLGAAPAGQLPGAGIDGVQSRPAFGRGGADRCP